MGPLDDLLVIDLSRHLPGPLAARLLADLGARVVKVEEPRHGDPVREAPPRVDGTGALAAILLSGLESIALDLKRSAGRGVLDALLARADVLLASFRPGTLERFGLGEARLGREFPQLVVCALSGWGADGPLARRAGHDLTYQALAGGLAPTAAMPAAPTADLTGAWSAVAAILAALHARRRTGRGAWIDASLYDAALHTNLTAWAAESAAPRAVGERLPLTGALPCYDLYATADGGWLAVACLEPPFWQRFCELLESPGLARRQYDTGRRTHARVARRVAARNRTQWREVLAGEDLPVEVLRSAEEALEHPQARARGVVARQADGSFRLAFPARLDGERPHGGGEVPALGEHTAALLAELGHPAAALSAGRRRRSGVGRRGSWKARLRRLVLAWRGGG